MKRPREYYQQIGRKGGQTTVQRHGRDHMSRIGKQGFQTTTNRHFQGQRSWHIAWLRVAGEHAYWSSTGLPMKRDRDGRAIWPEDAPTHPAHEGGLPF